jgi:hypothetical protein
MREILSLTIIDNAVVSNIVSTRSNLVSPNVISIRIDIGLVSIDMGDSGCNVCVVCLWFGTHERKVQRLDVQSPV